jgi:hypothetical protein
LFFRKKKRLVLIEEFFAVMLSTGYANIWSYVYIKDFWKEMKKDWGRTLLGAASNSYKVDIIFSTLMIILARYRPLYPHSTLTSQDGYKKIAYFYSKRLRKLAFVCIWSFFVAVVFVM